MSLWGLRGGGIVGGPAAVLACLAANSAALEPFVCRDGYGYRFVRCLSGQ